MAKGSPSIYYFLEKPNEGTKGIEISEKRLKRAISYLELNSSFAAIPYEINELFQEWIASDGIVRKRHNEDLQQRDLKKFPCIEIYTFLDQISMKNSEFYVKRLRRLAFDCELPFDRREIVF